MTLIAQKVEQMAVNHLGVGSNPTQSVSGNRKHKKIFF